MTDSELREMVNPLFVPCPVCKVRPGKKCRAALRNAIFQPHLEREEAALARFKEIFNLK